MYYFFVIIIFKKSCAVFIVFKRWFSVYKLKDVLKITE
jgi:hypothetical protein